MSVVVYKCTVCDREIEQVQNIRGLEFISRCTITDGCRGKLYQIDIKIDQTRSRFPDRVSGLDDWTQRNILTDYTQSVASIEWKIIHGMGVDPVVRVMIERDGEDDTTVLVDTTAFAVEIVNENELIIHFERAESGTVQLSSRSSKPVVFKELIQPVDDAVFRQLTTDSELTIATINTDTNVTIVLEFITPEGGRETVNYNVDDQPSIKSPWVSTDVLYIRSKPYTTRSFNLSDGVSAFSDGMIPNGSAMFIKSINGVEQLTGANHILSLLTNPPYSAADRNFRELIDISKINETNAASSLIYNLGELSVFDSLAEQVYPHIRTI